MPNQKILKIKFEKNGAATILGQALKNTDASPPETYTGGTGDIGTLKAQATLDKLTSLSLKKLGKQKSLMTMETFNRGMALDPLKA